MTEENKKAPDFELKIYFDIGENTLYELGYISLDILQLVIFGELIEKNERKKVLEIFVDKKPFGSFTRNTSLLNKYRNKATIKELSQGSITLIISGVSAMATVVSLIVQYRVQKKLHEEETIVFEISSNDSKLNKLLDKYDEGYYGKGKAGFEWLIKQLSLMNYNITLTAKDAYIIEKVSKDYEKRIIKILKKH